MLRQERGISAEDLEAKISALENVVKVGSIWSWKSRVWNGYRYGLAFEWIEVVVNSNHCNGWHTIPVGLRSTKVGIGAIFAGIECIAETAQKGGKCAECAERSSMEC